MSLKKMGQILSSYTAMFSLDRDFLFPRDPLVHDHIK